MTGLCSCQLKREYKYHLFRNFLFKSAQMPRLIGFTFFILSFSFLNAQEFGGNPPSIRWKQISTDTVRVIFPVGMDSAAQRVSSIVHFLAAKNKRSMKLFVLHYPFPQ